MLDMETRTQIANDRFEQLRAAATVAPAPPLRLRLGDWLIRAGRRLASDPDRLPSSGFAPEPSARLAPRRPVQCRLEAVAALPRRPSNPQSN
jgi:hypothetical protein